MEAGRGRDAVRGTGTRRRRVTRNRRYGCPGLGWTFAMDDCVCRAHAILVREAHERSWGEIRGSGNPTTGGIEV